MRLGTKSARRLEDHTVRAGPLPAVSASPGTGSESKMTGLTSWGFKRGISEHQGERGVAVLVFRARGQAEAGLWCPSCHHGL